MRQWTIRLMVFLAACSLEDVVKVDKPLGRLCAPGAHYVCPCGDETWASDWKSGMQYCGVDFVTTQCFCDGGADAD